MNPNEQNRKEKRNIKTSIIALIVAFITLVIGFLAYSNTVVVERELKSGKNNLEMYNIGFSKSNDRIEFGYIEPFIIKSDAASKTPAASSAFISGTLVTNIWANFYEPGQYVTYKFYVYNAGKEDLYLKDIIFKEIPYTNTKKICAPIDSKIPSSAVSDVCEYITLGVIDSNYSLDAKYNTVNNIKGVKIKSHEYETITVILGYETGAPKASTPFNIKFGDIEFKYSIYK